MSAPGWHITINRCVIKWDCQPFITTSTLYYNIWRCTSFYLIDIRGRSQFMGEIKAGVTKRA